MSAPEQMEDQPPAREPITLDIIRNIKTSQQQYGLRHGDYYRYRQYCTRRLQRLRKSLKITNSHRGKYKKQIIKDDDIPEDKRYILIPLILSERAWAYGMELKTSGAERNEEYAARKKIHCTSRLKRAASYSSEFHRLVELRASPQTILESKAYSFWMNGIFSIEKEQFQTALGLFQTSVKIFSDLAQTSGVDQQLYAEKHSQILPNIRYCEYMSGLRSDNKDEKNTPIIIEKKTTKSDQIESLVKHSQSLLAEENKIKFSTQKLEDLSLRLPLKRGSSNCSILRVNTKKPNLTDRLDKYDAGNPDEQYNLVDIPPNIELVCSPPVLFDIAGSHINFPSLDHRKAKKGLLSGIFGW